MGAGIRDDASSIDEKPCAPTTAGAGSQRSFGQAVSERSVLPTNHQPQSVSALRVLRLPPESADRAIAESSAGACRPLRRFGAHHNPEEEFRQGPRADYRQKVTV